MGACSCRFHDKATGVEANGNMQRVRICGPHSCACFQEYLHDIQAIKQDQQDLRTCFPVLRSISATFPSAPAEAIRSLEPLKATASTRPVW